MPVIGLDLGGTKLAGAILAEDGSIIERASCVLEGRGGADVGRLICEQLIDLLADAQAHNLLIESLGVSVPGIYHRETGTVWAPNIPGWECYPLRELLDAQVGARIGVAFFSNMSHCLLQSSLSLYYQTGFSKSSSIIASTRVR